MANLKIGHYMKKNLERRGSADEPAIFFYGVEAWRRRAVMKE